MEGESEACSCLDLTVHFSSSLVNVVFTALGAGIHQITSFQSQETIFNHVLMLVCALGYTWFYFPHVNGRMIIDTEIQHGLHPQWGLVLLWWWGVWQNGRLISQNFDWRGEKQGRKLQLSCLFRFMFAYFGYSAFIFENNFLALFPHKDIEEDSLVLCYVVH